MFQVVLHLVLFDPDLFDSLVPLLHPYMFPKISPQAEMLASESQRRLPGVVVAHLGTRSHDAFRKANRLLRFLALRRL